MERSPLEYLADADHLLAITSALLVVHQYSGLRDHEISSFLGALNKVCSQGHGFMLNKYGHQVAFRSPWFWQAMSVLGSSRADLFTETLVRELCIYAIVPADVENNTWSRYEHSVKNMSIDHVWKLFLKNSRCLGTGKAEWMCPGFEPWKDCKDYDDDCVSTECHLRVPI